MDRKIASLLCLFTLVGCATDVEPSVEGSDGADSDESTGEVVNELTLDSKDFPYDLESPIPFPFTDVSPTRAATWIRSVRRS